MLTFAISILLYIPDDASFVKSNPELFEVGFMRWFVTFVQKAHFLETDTELEEAHSVAACGGDTAVISPHLYLLWCTFLGPLV